MLAKYLPWLFQLSRLFNLPRLFDLTILFFALAILCYLIGGAMLLFGFDFASFVYWAKIAVVMLGLGMGVLVVKGL